jgi:hypothetical protein
LDNADFGFTKERFTLAAFSFQLFVALIVIDYVKFAVLGVSLDLASHSVLSNVYQFTVALKQHNVFDWE